MVQLPGRRVVMLSRTWSQPDVPPICRAIGEAIQVAYQTDDAPIVIGGAEVYRAALPVVSRIYLTEVARDVDGDTRFDLDRTGFVETERRQGGTGGVSFVVLDRVL